MMKYDNRKSRDSSAVQNVKAELLCWGLKSSSTLIAAYNRQNPFNDKRTGNAGFQLLLGHERIPVNVPVLHKFTNESPYQIVEKDGKYFLEKEQNLVLECFLSDYPNWYMSTTSRGIPMSKVLLVEGTRTLIGTVRNTCDYFKIKKPCAFCALRSYNNLKEKTPDDFVESVQEALSFNNDYHLHLTGGNDIKQSDRGLRKYLDYIYAIRKISDIPISVEISPPEELDDIMLAIDAGVNAFSINLEIWDDKLRKIFCPEKSKISKKVYFKTWNFALEKAGSNQVCSVLISGLENVESTIKGAEALINEGVIPTIIPFRKNDGILLENFRGPDPLEVIYVSKIVGFLIKKTGLQPKKQPGCTNCAACSVEQDFLFK